jgi:molybdopterin-guanine dinucleotide biosynthesis protein A
MSPEFPELYGLILIGGKSKRMGQDKSLLDYHGVTQWEHNVKLMQGIASKVFISVRKDQQVDFPNLIEDKYPDTGPFGAIQTAMETYPGKAFLVLATDIPFITGKNLEVLVQKRDKVKGATAFKSVEKNYAEPLICIWEPSVLTVMKELQHAGVYKLQKIFEIIDYKTIEIDDHAVQNVNTWTAYKAIKN